MNELNSLETVTIAVTCVSNGKWNNSRFSKNVPFSLRRSTTKASQVLTS